MKKIIMLFLLLSVCASAQTLSNMYFLSEDIGWVQTYKEVNYRYIPINSYRTTNGGVAWTQIDSMFQYTELDFYKAPIHFINDYIGYLVSKDYILYKTTDKGETWKFLADSLFRVQFADENVGYANSAIDVFLLKTTDGGLTWISTGQVAFQTSDYEVVTKDKVFIIGQNNKNYQVTTDGGKTWSTVFQSLRNICYDNIEFIEGTGYITTYLDNPQYPDTPGVFHSIDGGNSWNFIPNHILPYLSMSGKIKGIAHAGIDNGGWFDITSNGFASSERKRASIKSQDYFFYSCEIFYTCGDSGYFAKSTDCGDTWTEIPFVVLNPTDVDENNSTITNYSLEQNYPNPFNPSTRISYNLLSSGMTTIKIYDVLGKEIATLVNEYQTSGSHYVDFKAEGLNSGVYFYKINSGEYTEVKKMVFIK
ncbi:MAG: T9SS type A sorting domain-containing protein [Syntrophothermus sp.]